MPNDGRENGPGCRLYTAIVFGERTTAQRTPPTGTSAGTTTTRHDLHVRSRDRIGRYCLKSWHG